MPKGDNDDARPPALSRLLPGALLGSLLSLAHAPREQGCEPDTEQDRYEEKRHGTVLPRRHLVTRIADANSQLVQGTYWSPGHRSTASTGPVAYVLHRVKAGTRSG